MKKIISLLLCLGLMSSGTALASQGDGLLYNEPETFGKIVTFDNITAGTTYTGWSRIDGGSNFVVNSNCNAASTYSIVATGDAHVNAFELKNNSAATGEVSVKMPVNSSAYAIFQEVGEYTFSGDYLFKNLTGERKLSMKLTKDGSNKWVNLLLKDGTLKLANTGSGEKIACTLSENTWYHIDYVVNTYLGNIQVYVDNELKATDNTASIVDFTMFDGTFFNSLEDGAISWIDNVTQTLTTKSDKPAIEEYSYGEPTKYTDLNFDNYTVNGGGGIYYSLTTANEFSVIEDAEQGKVFKSVSNAYNSINIPSKDIKLAGIATISMDFKLADLKAERKIVTFKMDNGWKTGGININTSGKMYSPVDTTKYMMLDTDKWYGVKWVLNTYDGTEKVYVNNELAWTTQSDSLIGSFNYAQTVANTGCTTYYDNFFMSLVEKATHEGAYAVGDVVKYKLTSNATDTSSIHLFNGDIDCGAFTDGIASVTLHGGKNVIKAASVNESGEIMTESDAVTINVGYTLEDIDMSVTTGAISANGTLDEEGYVCVAVFDADGRFVNCNVSHADGPFSIEVNGLPSELTGYGANVIFLKDTSSLCPMFDSVEFN